jgi:hypothetical protein
MLKREKPSASDQAAKRTRRAVSGSPPPEIPSSSTPPSAAYTTAERFYQESSKNLVSGARAHAANKWTQVQSKRGLKLNIMADEVEPRKPFAFVAIARVKWVTLAEPNQWKQFDLTVGVEGADVLVGAAVQDVLERSPAFTAKGHPGVFASPWVEESGRLRLGRFVDDLFSKKEQKDTTPAFPNVVDGRNPFPEGGVINLFAVLPGS